jgi:hypothetical protein
VAIAAMRAKMMKRFENILKNLVIAGIADEFMAVINDCLSCRVEVVRPDCVAAHSPFLN